MVVEEVRKSKGKPGDETKRIGIVKFDCGLHDELGYCFCELVLARSRISETL